MAKAGNLKLNFVAKSIGIHFFGFEDIFRCHRDNENLKIHFGRMDTLRKSDLYALGMYVTDKIPKDEKLNFQNTITSQ